MHILIDLQGAQTPGSRHRGIGRYSLALSKELLRIVPGRGGRVSILLNAAFPDALVDIRSKLAGLVAPDEIHVWESPAGAGGVLRDEQYTRAATLIRDAVIKTIGPDAVLIASLFEGLGDEAVATVGEHRDGPLTAVVLYDLIPYIQHRTYLADRATARLYYGCVHQLRRADLALAISESARQEALTHLGLPGEDVVTISTAADAVFAPRGLSKAAGAQVLVRYGLRNRVVMCTGGIDARKNIDALIRAYAAVPAPARQDTTLAIVCAATEGEKRALEATGSAAGLGSADLCITGYVPEDDLVALYSICALFVFPSLHEGFGLPALEAMACGAPVIGSNRSSIPEVIGAPEALFDPEDEAAMAAKIEAVLTDAGFAQWLRARAPGQAARFSWALTAERTLDAIEAKLRARTPVRPVPARRPRLALVSPIPPQRSGIAGYVQSLAPELARHYDVDFVREGDAPGSPDMAGIGAILTPGEFGAVADRYDRIVYQLGNSEFHAYMPDLMARHPGLVVLHDPNLSGLANWMDAVGGMPGYWTARIRDESGYAASAERFEVRNGDQWSTLQRRHTCTTHAVRYATGIIVHSHHARGTLAQAYGQEVAARTHVVPLLASVAPLAGREAVRKRLGFAATDTVVCSFGSVAASKLHDVLLDAWFDSSLARDRDCRLLLVGDIGDGPFDRGLQRMIAAREGGERVRVTGYVSDKAYADHVLAADVAVQLRQGFRGESSAGVRDALAGAVPLVCSGGGAFQEIPDGHALKLSAASGKQEVIDALEWMAAHPEERRTMGMRAREHVLETATPRRVAMLYRDVIEAQSGCLASREQMLREMRQIVDRGTLAAKAAEIGAAVSHSLPTPAPRPRLLIDVTDTDQLTPSGEYATRVVTSLLRHEPRPYATEPFLTAGTSPLLARRYVYTLLGYPHADQVDEAFEVLPGDICLGFFLGNAGQDDYVPFYERCRVWGVPVIVICTDAMLDRAHKRNPGLAPLLTRTATYADLVLVEGEASARRLRTLLDETYPPRTEPVRFSTAWHPARLDVPALVTEARTTARRSGGLAWTPRERLIVRASNPIVALSVGIRSGQRIHTTGRSGFVLFGPYLPLPAGSYLLRWSVDLVQPADAVIDVCCRRGDTVLTRRPLAAKPEPGVPANGLRFDVPAGATDVEIRFQASAQTELSFSHYEITPIR